MTVGTTEKTHPISWRAEANDTHKTQVPMTAALTRILLGCMWGSSAASKSPPLEGAPRGMCASEDTGDLPPSHHMEQYSLVAEGMA